jgi:S1-C subfamily serine protease
LWNLVLLIFGGLLLLGCGSLSGIGSRQAAVQHEDPEPVEITIRQTVPPLPTIAPTATPLPPAILTEADAEEALLINIYQRVSPAVVHIEVSGTNNFFARRDGAGSGFVLDREGHIVTNNHVIEGARRIRVIFADGTRVPARVIGTDPALDLAVIRVDVPPDRLVPVELGNSDILKVGQRAIAIGNPFRFDQSMTTGIISAVGRVVEPPKGTQVFIPRLIQTDAAINPGNSGGPLLDSRGRVIGINTLIFSEVGISTGVGFAVPVNTLKRALPALLEGRRVGEPWLGVAGPERLSATMVARLALPQRTGAYVNFVYPEGPADEAGVIGAADSPDAQVQPGGDLIVAVDGEPVDSLSELVGYVQRHTRVGQTVELTVLRGDTELVIPVTVGERPVSGGQ